MKEKKKNSVISFAMLTKPVDEENFKSPNLTTQKFIFSNPYVSFLHLAGLDVYPIPTNVTREELKIILSKVNGVMLPGGMSSVVNPDPNDANKLVFSMYTKTVKMILEEAKTMNDAGDYFPVFGICLGFEAMLAAEADDVLVVEKKHEGLGYSATLNYTVKRDDSRFLSAFPPYLFEYMGRVATTHNWHEYMTSVEKFNANPHLPKIFRILSLSDSKKGSFSFISMIEGINYPFYAVQYHPEIAVASYYAGLVYPNYNLAAEIGRCIINFMLEEAKKNMHSIDEEGMKKLVANNPGTVIRDPPMYVAFHLWD